MKKNKIIRATVHAILFLGIFLLWLFAIISSSDAPHAGGFPDTVLWGITICCAIVQIVLIATKRDCKPLKKILHILMFLVIDFLLLLAGGLIATFITWDQEWKILISPIITN